MVSRRNASPYWAPPFETLDREGLEHLLSRLAPETSPSSGGGGAPLGHEHDPREWGAR